MEKYEVLSMLVLLVEHGQAQARTIHDVEVFEMHGTSHRVLPKEVLTERRSRLFTIAITSLAMLLEQHRPKGKGLHQIKCSI